jgi:hypothetical protein
MSVLDRLPPWATTGVGSLPYTDPTIAVARSARDYDLPFCPQLPRLEGDMIAEWLGGDPARCGWSPERDRERPRAWDALLRELTLGPPEHGLVKLQVTGPLTLACALEGAGGAYGAGDPGLRAEIAAWLGANVAGQVAALRARGLDAVVVVDEPALDRLAGTPAIARSWDPLRAVAAAWGLHVCCRVPWDVVDEAAPQLLSFDAVRTPVDGRAAVSLRRLLTRRGGRVAWGVLAVDRSEAADVAAARLDAATARCGADGAQSLLTASCGTGRQPPRRESRVARVLGELAARRRTPVG